MSDIKEQPIQSAREMAGKLKADLALLYSVVLAHRKAIAEWERKARAELLADETKALGKVVAFVRAVKRWLTRVFTVKLWVVGFVPPGKDWEVVGVFSSHDRAKACCLDKRYFLGSLSLNQPFPSESVNWPDMEVPNTSGFSAE